jgi:hypothetical protein
MFEVRLAVANRIAPTKNAQGIALTDNDARLSGGSGVPDSFDIPTRTTMPAPTMIMGMSTAQRSPMTDCLYLI